tara:strand:+ start:263 stop:874 length:612 start_codon:yes stop_codon:yes gene_type:complete
MAKFYFKEAKADSSSSNGVKIYELSCTTDINIKHPAVATKHAVEDGTSIVDNYYLDNRTATFSGIITDIRVNSADAQNTPVFQWIGEISALRKSKVLLTLVADTEVIPNCIITEFDLSKTKEEGASGWKCNLSFQEIDISERAKLITIKEPKPEVKDEVTDKSSGSGTSTEQVPTGIATTVGLDAINGGSAYIGSAYNTVTGR